MKPITLVQLTKNERKSLFKKQFVTASPGFTYLISQQKQSITVLAEDSSEGAKFSFSGIFSQVGNIHDKLKRQAHFLMEGYNVSIVVFGGSMAFTKGGLFELLLEDVSREKQAFLLRSNRLSRDVKFRLRLSAFSVGDELKDASNGRVLELEETMDGIQIPIEGFSSSHTKDIETYFETIRDTWEAIKSALVVRLQVERSMVKSSVPGEPQVQDIISKMDFVIVPELDTDDAVKEWIESLRNKEQGRGLMSLVIPETLSGNCLASFVTCVDQVSIDYDQAIELFRFAESLKDLEFCPVVNDDSTRALMRLMRKTQTKEAGIESSFVPQVSIALPAEPAPLDGKKMLSLQSVQTRTTRIQGDDKHLIDEVVRVKRQLAETTRLLSAETERSRAWESFRAEVSEWQKQQKELLLNNRKLLLVLASALEKAKQKPEDLVDAIELFESNIDALLEIAGRAGHFDKALLLEEHSKHLFDLQQQLHKKNKECDELIKAKEEQKFLYEQKIKVLLDEHVPQQEPSIYSEENYLAFIKFYKAKLQDIDKETTKDEILKSFVYEADILQSSIEQLKKQNMRLKQQLLSADQKELQFLTSLLGRVSLEGRVNVDTFAEQIDQRLATVHDEFESLKQIVKAETFKQQVTFKLPSIKPLHDVVFPETLTGLDASTKQKLESFIRVSMESTQQQIAKLSIRVALAEALNDKRP